MTSVQAPRGGLAIEGSSLVNVFHKVLRQTAALKQRPLVVGHSISRTSRGKVVTSWPIRHELAVKDECGFANRECAALYRVRVVDEANLKLVIETREARSFITRQRLQPIETILGGVKPGEIIGNIMPKYLPNPCTKFSHLSPS